MKRKITLSANKKILFLPHAIKQMSRPDRMITAGEIRDAVLLGESCLVVHMAHKRSIHVVCAPKTEYLAIKTAYLPKPDQWSSDFKTRR